MRWTSLVSPFVQQIIFLNILCSRKQLKMDQGNTSTFSRKNLRSAKTGHYIVGHRPSPVFNAIN